MFRFLKIAKAMTSANATGQYYINTDIEKYNDFQSTAPHAEPHEILASIFLEPLEARGADILRDVSLQIKAFSETFLFACLPAPLNARVLALQSLYQNQPNVLLKEPKFGIEYQKLMTPIHSAVESGRILEKYSQFNPRLYATGVTEIFNIPISPILDCYRPPTSPDVEDGFIKPDQKIESTSPKPQSMSSNPLKDRRCTSCNQRLNIDHRDKKIICPSCGDYWEKES